MTIGEINRNESYNRLIENADLGDQEEGVLKLFHVWPDSTAQFISKQGVIPLASVNGRINSLLEKGLLLETGSKIEETGRSRTTYRVRQTGEQSTQMSPQNTCLSSNQMRNIEKSLLDIRKALKSANSHQVNLIIASLEVTLDLYKKGNKTIGF